MACQALDRRRIRGSLVRRRDRLSRGRTAAPLWGSAFARLGCRDNRLTYGALLVMAVLTIGAQPRQQVAHLSRCRTEGMRLRPRRYAAASGLRLRRRARLSPDQELAVVARPGGRLPMTVNDKHNLTLNSLINPLCTNLYVATTPVDCQACETPNHTASTANINCRTVYCPRVSCDSEKNGNNASELAAPAPGPAKRTFHSAISLEL